jgi:hypothetical protein
MALSSRATLGIVFMFAVGAFAAGCGGGGGGVGGETAGGGSTGSGGSKATGGKTGTSGGTSGGSTGGASGGSSGGTSGGSSGGAPGTSGGSSGSAGAGGGNGATGGTSGGSTGGSSGSDAGNPGTSDTSNPPATGGTCEYKDDKQFCDCLGKSCGANTLKDSAGTLHAVFCGGSCAAPLTCLGEADVAGGAVGSCSMLTGVITAAQKKVAEELTNIWEYSQTTVDASTYAESENIKDHRGYTNGRAGFCTATGDAILVVECYRLAKPGNAMEKYLPALLQVEKAFLDRNGALDPDVQGSAKVLDAVGPWVADWKKSAADAAFRKCQDDIVEAVYYAPAIKHANDKGFATALTKAAIYDAQINQGEADPSTGVKAMMAKADAMAGNLATPPTRDDESKWLGAFLKIRAKVMYDDAATWRGDMFRTAEYEKLRKDGNFDLAGCIKIGTVSANDVWPGSGFTSGKADGASVGACP